MGKAGNAIVLDCRSLTHHYAPLDLRDFGIILCDTKVKHSLVDSEYNTRRNECQAGVKILQKRYPGIRSLRDVTPEMLEGSRGEFERKVYARCLYVVQEIIRVQQASDDLKAGNIAAFGKKMFETHEGLSHLYEVSCKELDFLVDEAAKFDGVIGARMMGGGFGGCTINLVRTGKSTEFIRHMTGRYRQAFNIEMAAYEVNVVDGAGRVKEDELTLWT